ncbi:hypothetical protein BSKO_01137 [Bryopsis sp. KO-2023]|nr:hypothetical protein BSKO_01137 [Bryopsis sp. KO-2023]
MDGRRVTILQGGDDGQGTLVRLPSPNSDTMTTYMIRGEKLLEINFFKEAHRSWLLGETALQDGGVYLCAPIDPLFLILPILERAKRKSRDGPGVFCDIMDALDGEGCGVLGNVLPEGQLKCICDEQRVENLSYVRINEQKVLFWLEKKVEATVKGLQEKGSSSFLTMDAENQTSYAVGLLGEYLSKHWLETLARHLSVDIQTGNGVLRGQKRVDGNSPAKKKTKVEAKPQLKTPPKPPKFTEKDAAGTRKISSFFKKTQK